MAPIDPKLSPPQLPQSSGTAEFVNLAKAREVGKTAAAKNERPVDSTKLRQTFSSLIHGNSDTASSGEIPLGMWSPRKSA